MFDGLTNWLAGDMAEELEGLRFVFNAPFGTGVAVALLCIAGLLVLSFFWPTLKRLRWPMRALLVGIRVVVVVLILFLLLDPCVTGKRIRRTDRAVILLFDDSKSMQVEEPNGKARGRRLIDKYAAVREEFEKRLRDKCQIVFCRFGESVERIRSPHELLFDQNESDLVGSVESVLADFEGANVAAVALFSDGAHQAEDRPADAAALTQFGVPVYGIGVGDDSPWRDLSVGPLKVTRVDVDENPVVVNAPVRASGFADREILVEAVADGSVIESSRLKLAREATEAQARLEFVPPGKGWVDFEVRVRPAPDPEGVNNPPMDRVAQNNTRRFLIDNREKTWRILYLCGRPNWENKFVRRALEEDRELKLTSLIRISGPEKTFKYRGNRSNLTNPIFEGTDVGKDMPRYDEAVFLRFGAKESELGKGYPDRAEELFPYQLVIWGEIEAEFFSQAQLELTRDYVRKRGGALLLLGGRSSFSVGGFDGTIIESLLPARLIASGLGRKSTGLEPDRPYQAWPSVEGLLSGAWSLDPVPEENRRLWEELPPLYRINEFALMRPAATVHASAESEDQDGESRPLFAVQRYGEGRSAVLATGSTWQWKLGEDEKDRRHERLWRQIVRSLAQESAEPIRLREKRDLYTVGNPAPLDYVVRDKVYDEREGLAVTVKATAPSGSESTLPVEESIQEAGLYSCEYLLQEPGVHKLHLSALDDQGKTVGTIEQAVLAEPDRREFNDARYNPAYLKQIAERTGGSFLPLEDMAKLPGIIPWKPSEQAEEASIHLWRLPGFYFVLVTLMIVEWYLRRTRGYR